MNTQNFTYKGHAVEIREIGHDFFTGVPWLGLFLDGKNTNLKRHGKSSAQLKRKATQLIDAQEAE